MNLKFKILLPAVVLILVLLGGFIFRYQILIAYHSWRMDAEFNTLFGDPQLEDNGLASFDVTGIDVDAVLLRYEAHRKRLVELGVLEKLSETLPQLASDDSVSRFEARNEFTKRMLDSFPGHRHWHLDSAGTFSTWVPVSDASRWQQFIDAVSSVEQ